MAIRALQRVLMFCCMSLLCAGVATAAQDDKVSLNFVNADIPEVVKAISTMTGRNFLIDPRVKGTINIVSAKPVSRAKAYDILLSALRMQGFAAVESNGVTKVMPEAEAKLYIASLNKGHGTADNVVTRVYPLKYASAQQLVNVIRPLITPNNVVAAYPGSNTLVVTDYASNLKRIEQIINSIDRQDAAEPVVIPVKHASALDLADTINELMGQGFASAPTPNGIRAGAAGSFFVLLADPRTNSLLVRTASPARLQRVRDLVKKLDTDSGAPGNIHVVYLRYAEADKLAQTLNAVISGKPSAPASQSRATPASFSKSNTERSMQEGGVVQADEESNALIITAPQPVYRNLRAVIDKLDVRRAEVYVEALIAEVRADKAAELGIQWQAAGSNSSGTTQFGGGTNFGTGSTNIGNVATSIVNHTPTLAPGLNIGILRGQNLGVLARALQTDADANILSTPNLLTLDNQEAKIVVGQNVPFLTGQYAQTGSTTTVTPFQTIERKDIGLTLKIKPQISEGGTVKLEIYQEVSSVDPNSVNNAAGLITNKRSLESTVVVDQGQTVVLGGLIENSVSEGKSQVPILGSIPLLGSLFRYTTREHTKTNLMVFIRPHIVRSNVAMLGPTRDRYEYLRAEEKNSQVSWNAVLPNMPAPQLPLLQNPLAASAVNPTSASKAKQATTAGDEIKYGESAKKPSLPASAPAATSP